MQYRRAGETIEVTTELFVDIDGTLRGRLDEARPDGSAATFEAVEEVLRAPLPKKATTQKSVPGRTVANPPVKQLVPDGQGWFAVQTFEFLRVQAQRDPRTPEVPGAMNLNVLASGGKGELLKCQVPLDQAAERKLSSKWSLDEHFQEVGVEERDAARTKALGLGDDASDTERAAAFAALAYGWKVTALENRLGQLDPSSPIVVIDDEAKGHLEELQTVLDRSGRDYLIVAPDGNLGLESLELSRIQSFLSDAVSRAVLNAKGTPSPPIRRVAWVGLSKEMQAPGKEPVEPPAEAAVDAFQRCNPGWRTAVDTRRDSVSIFADGTGASTSLQALPSQRMQTKGASHSL